MDKEILCDAKPVVHICEVDDEAYVVTDDLPKETGCEMVELSESCLDLVMIDAERTMDLQE